MKGCKGCRGARQGGPAGVRRQAAGRHGGSMEAASPATVSPPCNPSRLLLLAAPTLTRNVCFGRQSTSAWAHVVRLVRLYSPPVPLNSARAPSRSCWTRHEIGPIQKDQPLEEVRKVVREGHRVVPRAAMREALCGTPVHQLAGLDIVMQLPVEDAVVLIRGNLGQRPASGDDRQHADARCGCLRRQHRRRGLQVSVVWPATSR